MSKKFVVVVAVVCVFLCGAVSAQYLAWDAGMVSMDSGNLSGAYPAQNAFDSSFTPGGWRGDWFQREDGVGFALSTIFHGSFHSAATSVGGVTSPGGVSAMAWIAADFGESKTIYGADFWNMNQYMFRDVKDASIQVSSDGASWTEVWSGVVGQAPGNLPDLVYAAGENPDAPDAPDQYGLRYQTRADFGGAVDARYVLVNLITSYDDAAYVAVDEVKFRTVPEPASMVLLSLGSLMFVRRRKA